LIVFRHRSGRIAPGISALIIVATGRFLIARAWGTASPTVRGIAALDPESRNGRLESRPIRRM
jgi:hypothetical protein